MPVPTSKSDWDSSGKPPAAIGNRRQLWAKPLQDGAVAVLVINASPHILEAGAQKLSFKQLNVTRGPVLVRDVWARKDLGTTQLHSFKTLTGCFVRYTPHLAVASVSDGFVASRSTRG